MIYKKFYSATWEHATFLSMSPEQKLLFIWLETSSLHDEMQWHRALHGNGFTPLDLGAMARELGFTKGRMEASLRGFCGAFPDVIKVDWDNMEYLFQGLKNINP
jgi:hypothetical protein